MKDSYCVSKMCSFLHFWKYSYFHVDWSQSASSFLLGMSSEAMSDVYVWLNPRMEMFLRKEKDWSKTHNINHSRGNVIE